MTHVWMDGHQVKLEVLEPNPYTFNIMLDNLGGEGVGSDNHTFASMLVPKDDARIFINNLAKAMGVEVDFPPDADRVEVECLSVDYDKDDNEYVVSGDLREILTEDEEERVRKLWVLAGFDDSGRLPGASRYSGWTVNCWVADLFVAKYGSIHNILFDSEGSCLWAYTSSQAEVDVLKKYIIEKEFLK
jgi:hypothetical protein